MKKSLLERINDSSPILCDGAMATALYENGFYINRSFEELCLTNPQDVLKVHSDFRASGSEILCTNTFNATLPKLTEYGLQKSQIDILKASVRIAKEAIETEGYVLGQLGPLPIIIEPFGPTAFEEAISLYQVAAETFEQEEVDGFSLDGFHNLKNLEAAIIAIKLVSKKPIIAHLSIQENLKSSYGARIQDLAKIGDEFDLSSIGFCGEVGPSGMLTALEKLRQISNKPISIKPNAGMPKYVNDQWIYLCNPDYMGKFGKRFVQAGAKLIGGHCGVYPSHIKALSGALKMASHFVMPKLVDQFDDKSNNIKNLDAIPIEQRSNLGFDLKNNKKIVSIEILPPNGSDIEPFLNHCKKLKECGVNYVNIPDGARAVARVSSLHLASLVQRETKLECIPHFTARDRNLIGLQSDLLGSHISGVRNLLLVTGDPPKLGNQKGTSGVYDVDSIGLTHLASRMNHGLDMAGSPIDSQTNFCIGVALNPTVANQELELNRFKYKIEAGADFAITQPIYDIEAFIEFNEKLKGVSLPIIMGIWPLVSLRNAEFLKYEVPGVSVPDWVMAEMEKANGDKEESVKRGVEIAIKMIEKAKSLVAGFQVSAPFNRVSVALDVIHAV